jgi:hypothetical protein
MKNRINPKTYNSDNQVVKLNPKKSLELGLDKIKYGYISFGLFKQQIEIEVSTEVYKDEILIPNPIFKNLNLPKYIDYEVSVVNNTINLGPFIGIVVDDYNNNITNTRLKKLLNLTIKYSQINGAIVVFALDKINKSTLQIEGYCYNPKNNFWVKGVFPYPSSIFTTVGISAEIRNHFVSIIGNNLFNDKYLDDWEMHSLLSLRNDIKKILPYAALYETFNDISPLIKKHNRVFLKSLDNSKSKVILEILNSKDKFFFKLQSEGKSNEYTAKNLNEAIKYADKILVSKGFIIYEPLKMLKYDGKTTCIRTILQKNLLNQWISTGMFAIYGSESSVIGNLKDDVKIARAELSLKNSLSLTGQEINKVKQKIVSLCKSVCDALDESGLNYGNLEFDIALESSDIIKILAINSSNPDFKIALKIKERVLFYDMKSMPMFYAKSLAGFKA